MSDGKRHLAVLFGGASSEHEVSRMSVTSVLQNLSRDIHDVSIVGITKNGQWFLYRGPESDILDGSWESHPDNRTAFLSPDPSMRGLILLENGRYEFLPVDVVFPVLHGKNGEDGTLQGLFQLSGLPFVGCDTLASAACMDKDVTNSMLASAGIPQANFIRFYARDYQNRRPAILSEIERELHWPVFVKPANAGSSVGVSKAIDPQSLDEAVEAAAREDKKIVIEEAIVGAEVEVAVMGNENPIASVVGEIAPGDDFYSYDDKYKNGVSQLYIPARISEATAEAIRACAVEAYSLMGCTGLARVDFFAKEDGSFCLNEINTLPGFTTISMYPKLFMHGGMSYGEVLDRLIDCALQRQP